MLTTAAVEVFVHVHWLPQTTAVAEDSCYVDCSLPTLVISQQTRN